MRVLTVLLACLTAAPALAAADPPSSLDAALAHLATPAAQKAAIDDLLALVRIPSVSAWLPESGPEMQRAAQWTAARLKKAGLHNVRVFPASNTSRTPYVYGDWLEGGPHKGTVLIYGHADVQPADGDAEPWTSPPFAPVVRDGCVYGRGAQDDKGGLLGAILGVEAYLKGGKSGGHLPLNVKIFVELQEEIGSPDIDAVLATHTDLLACDGVLSADGSQMRADRGSLTRGLRGAAAFEVSIVTASVDTHSGSYGGSIANAAHVMGDVIASLHDAKGRVAIKGFYGSVRTPSRADRGDVATFAAAAPFNETDDLADIGASAPVGERGYSTLERRWLRPTCDVVGASAGFDGPPGSVKTIVPSRAFIKVVCRLVPLQTPDSILAAARAHVQALRVPGASLTFAELPFKATPYEVPRDAPTDVSAAVVLESMYKAPPMHTWMGGSIPVTAAFRKALGVDTTLFAFGLPEDRVHAPDERYRLSQFTTAREAYVRVLYELGGGREGELAAVRRRAEARDEL